MRQTNDLKAYVNYIFQSPVIEPAISLDELKDVLNEDRVALKLKAVIEIWAVNENYTDLKCFGKIFNKLFIIMDFKLVNYIPSSLREKIINAANDGH